MSGVIFEQRKIILAWVRYSNNQGQKLRPVVVISNDAFNSSHRDIICCPLTSELKGFGIKIDNGPCLECGNIPRESEIKSKYPLVVSKSICKSPNTHTKITEDVANQIITDIKEVLSLK